MFSLTRNNTFDMYMNFNIITTLSYVPREMQRHPLALEILFIIFWFLLRRLSALVGLFIFFGFPKVIFKKEFAHLIFVSLPFFWKFETTPLPVDWWLKVRS